MSNTRYGHSGVGGGDQDQEERKDEGWQRRQGGDQSREPGTRGEPDRRQPGDDTDDRKPALGTNTQGELAGIGDASRHSAERLDAQARDGDRGGERERSEDDPDAGTDQPPRMGGPLGADPRHPHLPEGAQTTETRGSGAGGFDEGVNAKVIGAVHQGVREEDPRDAATGEAGETREGR